MKINGYDVEEYKYDCDGGSICVGNNFARACFGNDYGDGEFSIFVSTDTTAYISLGEQWSYRGCVEGVEIKVYNYDCYSDRELDEMGMDAIAVILSGRYGIYAHTGDIWLQKWD